jgi:PadR family transcriptional regulator, regulatory protein PadR
MLDLLVLRALWRCPLNGWDIMQRIQLVSGGIHRHPRVALPALHRLEPRGLVAAEWEASENNRRVKF